VSRGPLNGWYDCEGVLTMRYGIVVVFQNVRSKTLGKRFRFYGEAQLQARAMRDKPRYIKATVTVVPSRPSGGGKR
jgi:hypothetical protein